MNRFTDARVIQIADFNREQRIVYFFTEKQRKNIAAIIKDTRNIVAPIED